MESRLILVRNDDGDLLCVVGPIPEDAVENELRSMKDGAQGASYEVCPTMTVDEFWQYVESYDEALLGDSMSDVPPSGSTSHA